MKICISTLGLSFNGNSLDKALGGSESAVIYAARELAKYHDVTVICNCNKPGTYDGVKYYDFLSYPNTYDILIVSRYVNIINRINAKMNILWVEDCDVQDLIHNLKKIDKIFVLSDYQKDLYKEKYQLSNDFFFDTRNGYDHNLIDSDIRNVKRTNNHYVYASRPERGLYELIKLIWPKVVEQNNKAKLHICGYLDYNESKYSQMINELKWMPSIILEGQLSKKEFFKLLRSCNKMLYPCVFPEVSCIAAIEAQACGCPVITVDSYALSETVKTDTKISWDQNFVNKFINQINRKDIVIPDMFDYSWYTIIKEWNEELTNLWNLKIQKSL